MGFVGGALGGAALLAAHRRLVVLVGVVCGVAGDGVEQGFQFRDTGPQPPDFGDFSTQLRELGVEVQELPLPLYAKGKGRGRGPSRGQLDVGGDAGYLLRSGLWHKRAQAMLSRQESFMSTDSVSTVQPDRRHPEFGFYGWSRRGLNDWRVFWLGGMEKGDESMDLL